MKFLLTKKLKKKLNLIKEDIENINKFNYDLNYLIFRVIVEFV